MKETRFFLDEDYPVKSKYKFSAGLGRYLEFFQPFTKEILVEASPDYLYSRNTPSSIVNSLPNVKLVFILRNPVDRFISWYNFCIQNSTIKKDISIYQYFEMQQPDDGHKYHHQHLMTLAQGKYSTYLQPYIDIFGMDRIHICFMENLKENPLQFMGNLCSFLNIESTFYNEYQFEIHNPTNNLKNQSLHGFYLKVSYAIRKKSHNQRLFHAVLKRIKRVFFPVYLKLNRAEKEIFKNSHDIAFLQDYYSNELALYEDRYRLLLHEQDTVDIR